MLLNVPVPHLLATVALRSYTPGLATAVALNLPVTVLLRSAFLEGYVRPFDNGGKNEDSETYGSNPWRSRPT
jgi:hypothetical protein